MTNILGNKDYLNILTALKKEIKNAQLKAHLAVNKELILLYWRIGKEILKRKQELGWGSKVIEQLSQDLRHEFPTMKGLSLRNLVYMQTFAQAYPDYEFAQQLAAQIPWGHNQVILDKVNSAKRRLFYMQKTIENGWSRNILVMQIESNLYQREGKALTNFKQTLPSITSDLAQQLFKDEYNFEFLDLSEPLQERQLEKNLISHIRDFLLELGTGFAFLGSQYKLVVGGDEFYADLVFYHTRLRCYVVIELKTGKFQPAYLGQLEFYLTAINKDIKHESDLPSIGLLLCQEANHVVIEYALCDKKQPLSISRYRTRKHILPKELETSLPTPEQFQHLFETLKSNKENKENND